VANAGRDTTVFINERIGLTGTFSDPEGDPVYVSEWRMLSLPMGSSAVLEYPLSQTTYFTPDVEGDYVIEFEVHDTHLYDTDTVVVTAIPTQQTDPWLAKASFPSTPRSYAVNFVIGGKAYLGTGSNGSSGGCSSLNPLGDFWEYTPAPGLDGGTWIQKADFPGGPRDKAVGFAVNGKGYLGMSGINSDFYEYDPALNTWRAMADISLLSASSGFAVNGKGYVIGWNTIRELWQLDPLDGPTGTWSRMADLPVDPTNFSISFVIGDLVYVFLGSGSNNFLIYNSLTDQWSQQPDYPGSSGLPGRGGCFVIGTIGYVSDSSNEMYAYDTQSGQWTQMTDRPGYGLVGLAFGIGDKGYMGFTCASCTDLWEYNPDLEN
jgi:N-acetylneuraminic acid mutarotase